MTAVLIDFPCVLQVDLVTEELSTVLLLPGDGANTAVPRIFLYLSGLLHLLDSLLTAPEQRLPLSPPVIAQAKCLHVVFKRAHAAALELWCSSRRTEQVRVLDEIGQRLTKPLKLNQVKNRQNNVILMK